MKTLARDNRPKCIDVVGLIVVTNKRRAAEQIESDKVENTVINGANIGISAKVGKQ